MRHRLPLPPMFHRPGGAYGNLSTTVVVGLALAQARCKAGMTQADLAEAAGVALRTVSRAETSGRVSLAHFVDLVNALDLRIGLAPAPAMDAFDDIFTNPRNKRPPSSRDG